MAGEIEALGDAVTGGMLASAVERHGERGSQARHRCLNCGHFLDNHFCPACGQPAHVHRSVGAFGHDILHSVLHFEGKAWRTLPMLFLRPGELTRRYVNGERARFVSPLALFLFAVFMTFAVFSAMGVGGSGFDAMSAADRQTAANQVEREFAEAITEVEEQIVAARAAGRPTAALEAELGQRRATLAAAERMIGIERAEDGEVARNFSFLNFKTGSPAVDAVIKKANDNPALLLYKLQNNAYKFAWALIPLSAPFLWLLYPFSRRFGIYDHLVFITYSISFMLLLAILLRLAGAAGLSGGWISTILLLYPPFHMYRQLRGAYRSSRLGALLRTGLLLMFSILTLTLFTTGLLALGALG
jgi:hypothetical protein